MRSVAALSSCKSNEGKLEWNIQGPQGPTGAAGTAGRGAVTGNLTGAVTLHSMDSLDLPIAVDITVSKLGAVILVSYNIYGWSQHSQACVFYTRPTINGIEAGDTTGVALLPANLFGSAVHTAALPGFAPGSYTVGVRAYSNCPGDIYIWPWGGTANVAAHGNALTAVVLNP